MQWGYIDFDFNSLFDMVQNLGLWIKQFLTTLTINFWAFMEHWMLSIEFFGLKNSELLEIAQGKDSSTSITSIFNDLVSSMTENQLLHAVVMVTTVLGVFYIFMKYGAVVYQNYFNKAKGHENVTTTDFFKRVFTSLIMLIVLPFVLINGFYFSIITGLTVSKELSKSPNYNTSKQIRAQYYYDHLEFGLSPTTYCVNSNAQAVFGGKGFRKLETSSFPIALKKENNQIALNDLYIRYCSEQLDNPKTISGAGINAIGTVDTYISYDWKGKPPAMVMQTLLSKTNLWHTPIRDTVPQFFFINLTSLLYALMGTIINLIVIYNVAMGLADVVALIIMLWYYCGEYLSMRNVTIFRSLNKKVIGIFATTFFILSMYGTFLHFVGVNEMNVINLIIGYALILSIFNGSSTIKGMVEPTSLGKPLGQSRAIRKSMGG